MPGETDTTGAKRAMAKGSRGKFVSAAAELFSRAGVCPRAGGAILVALDGLVHVPLAVSKLLFE